MNDHFWMYRDLSERFYRQDYLQEVESFTNFVLFKLKNISAGKINIHAWRVKIKSLTIKMLLSCIYLKKMFIKKYLYRFAQENPYVPHETMLEKMVGSTSNFHN
jgi:hypothetical protein